MGMKLGSLMVLLLIVLLLFGTKRLRNVGEDLAEALKSFRRGMQDEDKRDIQ